MSTPNPAEVKWLIWSHEHAAWWRPGRRGYTEIRAEAGRYEWAEALVILANANYNLKQGPNEALVPDIPNPYETKP